MFTTLTILQHSLWNKFDAIIIDEVHSLVTDATYQAATFDVFALIQEYLKLYQSNELQDCACKRMILMTGTPQPLDAFAALGFPEELTNTIDLFEKCDNVVPKNVILVDKETAWHRMRTLLSNGEKAIYFSNRTLSEAEVRSKFSLSDSTTVGVSFSKDDKRKKLTQEERDRLLDIDESLAEHSVIPDDVRLFVTTSCMMRFKWQVEFVLEWITYISLPMRSR